uniref:Uncharacterized protein n=1 Tax=Eptatretus burgeri TaxID=7764 RepID=A0A8C4R1U0_EPTBU
MKLGMDISTVSVIPPIPDPGSHRWFKEASRPSGQEQPWIYVAPMDSLELVSNPEPGPAGELLRKQPVLRALDRHGQCVSVGLTSWRLVATLLRARNGTSTMFLNGIVRIPFSGCWANYTNLGITEPGVFQLWFDLEGRFHAASNLITVRTSVVKSTESWGLKLRMFAGVISAVFLAVAALILLVAIPFACYKKSVSKTLQISSSATHHTNPTYNASSEADAATATAAATTAAATATAAAATDDTPPVTHTSAAEE